jgi:hypothetical protein
MSGPTSPTAVAGSAAILIASCVLSAAISVAAERRAAPHPDADRAVSQTLRILDRAIHRLASPSADYRAVLSEALAALPADADDTAADAMRTFLRRAPQPGPAFRCSRDFVSDRARDMLLRTRDILRKDYVAPLQAVACSSVPFALDLAHARRNGGWLDIYGYDFDRVSPEMVLVTTTGYHDVTSSLVSRSHYHLAFKLGEHVPWSSDAVSLGVTWGHIIHYSIALVRPTSQLCALRLETIPAGRTLSYSPLPIDAEKRPVPPGARVSADVRLHYSSNKVEATVCMAVADPDTRSAGLGGCTVEYLYTTDPDWIIEGLLGEEVSQVSYRRGRTASDVKDGTRRGLVRQWTFSDFNQSAASQAVSVQAHLNDIRLVAVADRACVSPMAYLEAVRTGAIDPATKASIDRQLPSLDPAVLKLRPRFSAPGP